MDIRNAVTFTPPWRLREYVLPTDPLRDRFSSKTVNHQCRWPSFIAWDEKRKAIAPQYVVWLLLNFRTSLKRSYPQFYSELCIPGRAYQKFYEEVKENGVDFIRAAVTEVSQSGKGLAIKYKTEDGKENTLTADMAVLNPALEPGADSAKLAEILNIPQDKDGFFSEKQPDLTSVDTVQEGIFIAGCAQGPKDIAETVAEAEATVGRILSLSR